MKYVHVKIEYVEVTQCIQYWNGYRPANDAPLVRGKPTVVRVYPIKLGNSHDIPNVTARLIVSCGGVELGVIEPENNSILVNRTELDREDQNSSLNFVLEPDWYSKPSLDIQAELILPHNYQNRRLNTSQTLTSEFTTRRGLTIQYLRVRYNHEGWTNTRTDNIPRDRVCKQKACEFLRSVFPVDPTEVTYEPFPQPVLDYSNNIDCTIYLNHSTLIDYVSTLLPSSLLDSSQPIDQLYAWTPEESLKVKGLTMTVARNVAIGNDDGMTIEHEAWRSLFAHEIAHNYLGTTHPNDLLEGNQIGFDTLNIFPPGSQVVKRYPPLHDGSQGGLRKELLVAENDAVDATRWITKTYYERLFNAMTPHEPPLKVNSKQKEFLVVSGQVSRAGSVEFFGIRQILASPEMVARIRHNQIVDEENSTHSIDCSVNGKRPHKLVSWTPKFNVSYCGDVEAEKKEDPVSQFFFVLDSIDGEPDSFQLSRNNVPLEQFTFPQSAPESGKVNRIQKAGFQRGVVELNWSSGELNKDNPAQALLHTLYFSNDNRESWQMLAFETTKESLIINEKELNDGKHCYYRVRSSNGYNFDENDSEVFSKSNRAYSVRIISPQPDSTFKNGQSVLLMGYLNSRQNAKQSPLAWYLNNEPEPRGTGKKLVLRKLPIGKHKVSLRTQSNVDDSNIQHDSITIIIN